jgi:hypothetical protein
MFFFIQADATWLIDTYHEDRLLHSQTLQWNPTIALIPMNPGSRALMRGTEYYRFNTAFRAEASLTWKARYSMQVFWERGLNGISASFGNTTTLHLGYTGISLGVNLR